MRCKTCEYRLWNLPSRQCPECGSPFRPSEFEFVPNSVQFCCPHCGTPYYGTGPNGHLAPTAFNCVSCGQHVHMDQMVILPTEGITEEETRVDRTPWLERRERGRFRAWLATIGRALISPARLMRATPVGSSVGEAWSFALWTSLVIALAILPFMAMPMLLLLTGGFGPGAPGPIGWLAAAYLVFPIAVLCGIGIWGAVVHGLLRLTGSTHSGARRTYQVVCYSSGANVVSAIPIFGLCFGWIWWAVSATLMVKEGQGVHGGRAAFAVLTFPILVFTTFVGLYVWAISWTMSMAGATPFATSQMAMMAPDRQMASSQTTMIRSILRLHSMQADRMPRHAIEMVTDSQRAGAFVTFGSGTVLAGVPVADTTLEQFAEMSPSSKEATRQKSIDALPAGMIAHRLGDFVFTYHGTDFKKADPKLWVVILSADPDSNPPASFDFICVGTAGSETRVIPISGLPAELAKQNQLRAKQDLPPLPDPSKVTHSEPAVAEPGRPGADQHR